MSLKSTRLNFISGRGLVFSIIFGLLIISAVVWLVTSKSNTTSEIPVPNWDYEKYNYGKGDSAKIVDIGTVPTTLNTTFMGECIIHDKILKKQLDEQGWKIRLHGFKTGNAMIPYAEGRLDLMLTSDIPALNVMAEHNFGIFSTSRQGYNSIIAARTMTPADLKGLKVGYPLKTTTHFTLERALASVNLTIDDIISVEMQPREMESALRNKKVDAIVSWEPIPSAILANIHGSHPVLRSDALSYTIFDLDFTQRNPNIQKAILAAIVRATRWIRQDDNNIMESLRWVRKANINFAGTSDIEINSKWINLFKKESIDYPSFPMIPLNLTDDNGLLYQQFQFQKKIGMLPKNAEWNDMRSRVFLQALPEIIKEGIKWQIDIFDYSLDKPVQIN